jgi:hypothetical protein
LWLNAALSFKKRERVVHVVVVMRMQAVMNAMNAISRRT